MTETFTKGDRITVVATGAAGTVIYSIDGASPVVRVTLDDQDGAFAFQPEEIRLTADCADETP